MPYVKVAWSVWIIIWIKSKPTFIAGCFQYGLSVHFCNSCGDFTVAGTFSCPIEFDR